MLRKSLKFLRRKTLGFLRYTKLSLKNRKIKVGENFYCGINCFVSTKNRINIGDNFYMGNYCHLSANAEIGNDVLFASFVSLVGGDHKIDFIDVPIRFSG